MSTIDFSRTYIRLGDFLSSVPFPYTTLLRVNIPVRSSGAAITWGDVRLPLEHWMNKQIMDGNLWHLTEESKWK